MNSDSATETTVMAPYRHRRKLVKISGGLEARGSEAVEGVSGWGHHGECGARAYKGVWGQSPQRGPGAEPLVRGAKPS